MATPAALGLSHVGQAAARLPGLAGILPGFVATEDGRPAGYVFCVYEQHKAVIGDVFATANARERANRIEATAAGAHAGAAAEHAGHRADRDPAPAASQRDSFVRSSRSNGFDVLSARLYGAATAPRTTCGVAPVPASLHLRPLAGGDFAAAGRLIALAYQGHLDSVINDQYRTHRRLAALSAQYGALSRAAANSIRQPRWSWRTATARSWPGSSYARASMSIPVTSPSFALSPALRHAGLGRLLLTQCMQALSAQGLTTSRSP